MLHTLKTTPMTLRTLWGEAIQNIIDCFVPRNDSLEDDWMLKVRNISK